MNSIAMLGVVVQHRCWGIGIQYFVGLLLLAERHSNWLVKRSVSHILCLV